MEESIIRNKSSCNYNMPILFISYMLFSNNSFAASTNDLNGIHYNQYASAKTFTYDPRTYRWTASHKGKVIRTGSGSGGSKYCSDVKRSCKTPTGTFRVVSKGSASCRSSRYPLGKGGAPMPHCMFFSKNYAIHGSPDVPRRNASHGCIRVKTQEARWLHKNFIDVGTRVVVKPY